MLSSPDKFTGFILNFGLVGILVRRCLSTLSIMLGVLILAGCMSGKSVPFGSVPGVTSSGFFLHVPDDGGPVVITGWVDTLLDKKLVEDYVRYELGYEQINNRLRFD